MINYILLLTVTLIVISYNSVFTQNTIDPEVSKTCASNNGQCGREIQKMYHIITHLKDKINALEIKERMQSALEANLTLSQSEIRDLRKESNMLTVKQQEIESRINALETNLTLSNNKIQDLTEQNENLVELKTNLTIIAEKYLPLQTEMDGLRDKNSALEGNMSSIQSENNEMELRINNLECLLSTTTGVSNASNCADLYQLGNHDDGLYTVNQSGVSYQLFCDMTQNGRGWTVIQRRFDGSVDFYRNWESYKTGFGNLTKEFWLGNDLISSLTKHKKFDLYIYLEDFSGGHRYAEYSDFQLGDEEEKYALHFGRYSGDAGDSLTYHKGKKFSTYDNDNDDTSTNCARARHGAFWFKSCDYAHLNGQYSNTSSGAGYDMGLVWEQWRGKNYSLKKTIMKIRPMDF